jgi:hypothetical protein
MRTHCFGSTLLFAIGLGLVAPNSTVVSAKSEQEEAAKDILVEFIESTYQFENDGTGEIIRSSRISVLTHGGRERVAQIPFPYSSQLEDLRIDYFRTVKKDGTQIEADPSSAMETALPLEQVAPTFTDVRVKAMIAPQLLGAPLSPPLGVSEDGAGGA